jgi:hypothetical protein
MGTIFLAACSYCRKTVFLLIGHLIGWGKGRGERREGKGRGEGGGGGGGGRAVKDSGWVRWRVIGSWVLAQIVQYFGIYSYFTGNYEFELSVGSLD